MTRLVPKKAGKSSSAKMRGKKKGAYPSKRVEKKEEAIYVGKKGTCPGIGDLVYSGVRSETGSWCLFGRKATGEVAKKGDKNCGPAYKTT